MMACHATNNIFFTANSLGSLINLIKKIIISHLSRKFFKINNFFSYTIKLHGNFTKK
jgi:hypothetical protein